MSDTCAIEDCDKPRYQRYLLCAMHQARKTRHGTTDPTRWSHTKTATERFIERVVLGDDCWEYEGGHSTNGYARMRVAPNVMGAAHRFAYELIVGPIPEGMDLDHLCRNRGCVNPKHLEPVTRSENTRRGIHAEVMAAKAAARTHCGNGHPIEESARRPDGKRWCRACHREYARRARAKRKEEAA